MKKLLVVLLLTGTAAAQDTPIRPNLSIDEAYKNSLKVWLACTQSMGPNRNDIDLCTEADVSTLEMRTWVENWLKTVLSQLIFDKAMPWVEENKTSTLPQDHQDDVIVAQTSIGNVQSKRGRAIK